MRICRQGALNVVVGLSSGCVFFPLAANNLAHPFVVVGSRLSKRSSAVSFKGALSGTPSQARLLCFVVTSIAKLATRHKDLAPRARVSLAKVRFLNCRAGQLAPVCW